MELKKINFTLISILLIVLLPPHMLLGLFFHMPIFPASLEINNLLLLCTIYDLCFLAVVFYLFCKDKIKNQTPHGSLRCCLYYRGKIHTLLAPCAAFSLFFFLIFYSVGTIYNPLKSIPLSAVLGVIASVIILTMFFTIIKRREIAALEEFEEIDRQSQRILKDLEKFEKQG